MNTNIKIIPKRILSQKKIIRMGLGVAGILAIYVVSASVYIGWNLTSPKREAVKDTPKEYGLVYENVTFKSKNDGTLLKGWWIPSQIEKNKRESDKTIIFSHGYGNSRGLYSISVINLAKRLTKEGYNILVYDFRASGESEGKFVSIGLFEKYDLLSAIDFAKTKDSKTINLMGWSMGAATSILAAGESDDVNAVIADSPFSNLREYLSQNLPIWSKLPDFPFTKIILYTLPLLRGVEVDGVNPCRAAGSLKDKRLLLIHSKADTTISYKDSEAIYNAVKDKNNVDIWLTDKADHIKSYLTDKEKYEDKVVAFFR